MQWKIKINGTFFITLLFIIIALLFSVSVLKQSAHYSGMITPRNGEIDLTAIDLSKNIILDGEWFFYKNKLLSGISSEEENPEKVKIPHFWKSNGYGTYRLKIKGLEKNKHYCLLIPDSVSAYKLIINNKIYAESGTVGTDIKSEKLYLKSQIVYLLPEQEDIEIIMQISNFHLYPNGFERMIKIGLPENIIKEQNINIIIQMILFGGLIIISLYSFSLFFLNTSDMAVFYYAVFNLIISFRILITGERVINHLVSNIDWYMLIKIQFILGSLLIFFFTLFFKKFYPLLFRNKIVNIFLLISLLFSIFPIVLPLRFLETVDLAYFCFAIIYFCYLIIILLKAIKADVPGTVFAFSGIIFLLGTVFMDFIFPPGSNVIPLGMFIFTIFQSLVVAEKHSFVVDENRKLSNIASRDGMTNLYKREHFNQLVNSIIEEQEPIIHHAMMFIDIDDFKSINDTFGHDAGDEVIISVAQNILHSMRYSDIACRYGGDEFVVWLHNTTVDDAKMIAGRILKSNLSPVSYDKKEISVTVSIGASFYPDDGISFEELIKKCDKRMYSAKKNGKNCYCLN